MMNGIASRLGIPTASLEQLLGGIAPNEVASRLSVSTTVLAQFLDGNVTASLARKFGGDADQLQQLRDRLGREGAIGMVIGLMARSSQ